MEEEGGVKWSSLRFKFFEGVERVADEGGAGSEVEVLQRWECMVGGERGPLGDRLEEAEVS